jgi:hypothetical protein
MNTIARMFATLAFVGALAAAAGGCASSGVEPRAGDAPVTPGETMDRLTGTLRSGFMGIGGEHTGWALLDGDGPGAKQTEVDVSRVRDAARAAEGRRVTLVGRWVEKRYVERGVTRVFAAERIE